MNLTEVLSRAGLTALRAPEGRLTIGALEAWLAREVVGRHTPGLAVGIATADGAAWTRAFGHADLLRVRPVAPETRFRWYSVTKLFTATAIMQLVERGRLGLDTPVARDLPWFRVRTAGRFREDVTVRALLTHTSGLVNPLPFNWADALHEPQRDVIAFVRELVRRHGELAPGPRRARYSNLGYLVLGELVRELTGEPFRRWVRREVLEPLGMSRTAFRHDNEALEQTAVPHERLLHPRTVLLAAVMPRPRRFTRGRAGPFLALEPFRMMGESYGGLIGTIDDLMRFSLVHLRSGELAGVRVLEPSSVRLMQRVHARASGGINLGLGWFHEWVGDRWSLFHTGSAAGYRAEVRIFPDEGLAVAALANAGHLDVGPVVNALSRLDRDG